MVASGSETRLGTTIETYRLVRILGAGSTSVVYLGQRVDDPDAQVAVKVLTLSATLQPSERVSFQARFTREARAASRLEHEHILPVLSYGEAQGVGYMIMPWVARGTIGTRLAAQHGPLPLTEVAQYLIQLGSALDYAHSQGLVHRDVKPSNVLLDDTGTVYLSDFGIARLFDTGNGGLTRIDGGLASLTHTGEVLGTPYYMAPEQIKGEPVGPATDVYALGVVTYQLVTGQLPYQGETPLAVAMQHLQEMPCPPHLLRQDIPDSVEAAILRALEKEPTDRFASAGELAEAFSVDLELDAQEMDATWTPSATRTASTPLNLGAWTSRESEGTGGQAPGSLSPGMRSPGSLSPGMRSPGDATTSARSPGDPPAAGRSPAGRSPGGLSSSALSPGAQSRGTLGSGQLSGQSPRSTMTWHQELLGATVGQYRVVQLIESGQLGAVFQAQNSTDGATYRLRMLPLEPGISTEAQSIALARFQQVARDLAALQHPYILPVVDYGSYQGMQFLVTPAAPGPSLSDRLDASGPMQLAAAGRYLDDIAGALEYAHGRAIIHRNLTSDCVFIDEDGHAVVADFEVRRLVEMNSRGAQRPARGAAGVACTPEQLSDNPVGTYTDVYALGEVLYEMLTGRPVFTGETSEEIVQQHLHTTVPSLRRWRAGLPAALENVLARALAKDPAARFRHPGELSNAYRQLVDNQRDAKSFVVSPLPSVSVVRQRGQLLLSRARRDGAAPAADRSGVVERDVPPPPAPPPSSPRPRNWEPDRAGGAAAPTRTALRRGRMLYGGIAAVALLGMVVAVFALNGRVGLGFSTVARHPTPRPTARVVVGLPVGTLVYVDSQNGAVGHLDALKVRVSNLPALPANTQYDAWLINDQTHAITALGKLNGQGSTYTLDYQQPNTNLLALGNDLWITPEQGSVDTPSNRPVVIGVYPNGSYPIIRDMLVSFPNTPNQISLVSGLLDQAGRLSAQAQLLQASAGAGITARVQCAAQNIVDIIVGAGEQHYQAPTAFCVSRGFGDNGDGFGLLGSGGYLADVKGHAALIGSLPNATPYMHTHSVHVKIAVANIEGWVTTIEQDAINLVNNPNDPSKVAEVVSLADRAYHGVDLDGDESIDPVPGEAGAVTAYEHTQLMVSLDLAAPQTTP